MKTMRKINREMEYHLTELLKLEQEKNNKYHSYEYFLTPEYAQKLIIIFTDGIKNHPDMTNDLKLLYEILTEYTKVNNKIKNEYYLNLDEKIKLFNFIGPDNKVYLLLVNYDNTRRTFKTFLHNLNNKSHASVVPKFDDLKSFVEEMINKRNVDEKDITSKVVNALFQNDLSLNNLRDYLLSLEEDTKLKK